MTDQDRQTRSAPDSLVTSPSLQAQTEETALSRSQSILRQTIKNIHADPCLTPQEKARKVQLLMMAPTSKPIRNVARPASPIHDIPQPTLTDMQDSRCKESFGCSHYLTGSKIYAECCDTWHPCRFCHDEKSEREGDSHLLDRQAVRFMLCQHCKTAQPVGQHCRQCEREMASYYCSVCKFFDDDRTKEIFHCGDCGVCRRGRRQDYVHCERCHGCISAAYHSVHRCLEGSLDAACPICSESLFTTTMPVMFMRCGHAIHSLCFHQHSRESFQCPVCLKSVGDMTELYKNIDAVLSLSSMPAEYAAVSAEILCNDCERRSVTRYHFLYHKCVYCQGYNTKLIRSFGNDAPPEQVISEGDIAGVERVVERMPSPVSRAGSSSPHLPTVPEDTFMETDQ